MIFIWQTIKIGILHIAGTLLECASSDAALPLKADASGTEFLF
jgi:hypothetical protein